MTPPAGHGWLTTVTWGGVAIALLMVAAVALIHGHHHERSIRRHDGRNIKRGSEE